VLGQPGFHLYRQLRVQLPHAVQAEAVAKLRIGVLFQVGLKLGPVTLIIPDLLAGSTYRD
jgi:hypothetical protein